MKISPILGWNRVDPPHELDMSRGGECEASKLQNYIAYFKKISKVGGTEAYNTTALPYSIPWHKRSYHKLGDGSFVKRTLCFSRGVIYYGDDTAKTLTSCQAGFNQYAFPSDMTIQVSENSILYFFDGDTTPYYYDGNGSYTFYKSTLDSDITQGVVHLDRGFYLHKNSSTVSYSGSLLPGTMEDEFIVGNDKDSVCVASVLGAEETLYIFKNNSIWQLYGRTPATFQVRQITNKYGLATRRAIYPVGSGFIFLDQFTKELYFFGGSESSIYSLTEKKINLRDIIDTTADSINACCMTTHNGLFRFAFQHREAPGDYNDSELVYVLNNPRSDGLPKWSLIRGSNVVSYSTWNQQGDSGELVTGRSDTGKLMYHDRGWNWDSTNPIETIVRTAEITADEEFVVRFKGFFVKGKPGGHTLNSLFRYFLNGRYSLRGESSLNMKGETRLMGEIPISQASLFNDRINPLSGYSRGNSIAFEIYDQNNGRKMEVYSIAFRASKRYRIRNSYV